MPELESMIEQKLIEQLVYGDSQWTYRKDLKTEADLWANFRYILEQNNKDRLDGEPLSDQEFEQVKNQLQFSSFYKAGEWLVGENGKVQVHVQRDTKRLHLVVMNHEHIAGGSSVYEIINQYSALNTDENSNMPARDRRFDVTLLINGLPMIHIELKNKQHSYMDGFRQIKKYIGEGKFTGIFSAVQMFVISNGVNTKYFSAASDTELNEKFVSGWLDQENNPVSDYIDFAKSVLSIPQAHEMIARYTVLDKDAKRLILLRPYQIHAIEAVREASKNGKSGFIWHTTGSGKTLTSYKTTRNLLMDIPSIDKAIFLIDRKDLDTQTTMAFQAYANNDLIDVDETDNVNDLKKKLKSADRQVIVTTIQKLQILITKRLKEGTPEYTKMKNLRIAFVVDECHRAVTPGTKRTIERFFGRSLWYGFTGTPRFAENPYPQKGDLPRTTEETICNDPQVCRIVDLPVYYELETNNGNRDYRIQIGGHYMNYNTVYVGMDVHKESFTLCSCKYEDEKASHYQRTPASYKNVLRYLAFLRTIYGEDTRFVCGYEAGCLGYSLYHQLENFNVECVILAPTTMLEQRSKRRIKTDKRDAEIIARSLAQHNYSPVHIPTETDNQTKEFIRMRDDHKAELKKIKQQILSFCLRQGYQYDGSGNWTAKHVKWLRSLKTEGLYKEILDEYLLTYTILTDKLNRLDQRIEELASKEEYKESVSKLTCFLGIKTHTALSVIVEVGDFQRFVSARKFAGYLGLVPGQHSSGDDRNGLGITKAGNTHVRRLLVESAQSYTRGKIGYKSRVLRSRQAGNSPQVINYADRANERLRRRYYKMVLKDGKKYNIAKTAIARELACFIWGMMTDNIY